MKNFYDVLTKHFVYLIFLTVFFILIELAFFILCNDSYLNVFVFVSDKMHLPLAILPGILFFIFAQLLVHFLFCLLTAIIATSLIIALKVPYKNHLIFFISVWLIGVLTVMLANSYYFPNSHFAQLCNVFSPHEAMSDAQFKVPMRFVSGASRVQPNIIIVGVDSLRPDMLSFFSGEANTPFMSQFLSKATVFNEAITPLARTYPSWVGILTGEYPVQTRVRTNLAGLAKSKINQTLPALLRQQGYETIYATDETRFSNIDKNFGFDTTITPPIGLNDFLLGTFNDFPLSNLVINTFVGKWLFPYNYANRASYVTYNPNSFLQMLHAAILRDHTKPLFLAVHFCLPHHPYLYAGLDGNGLSGQARYLQSIHRADLQVKDFFALLQQARLLDHAVVVLLSDHGEALEFAGDRMTEREAYLPQSKSAPEYYPPSADKLAMNQSVGHGGDVLSMPQFHSLLAFRLYGVGEQRVGVIPGAVTLLDIKPTLLALSSRACHPARPEEARSAVSKGGAGSSAFGPASLLPQITTTQHPPTRMLFLESDYSPEAVRSIYPQTRKLLLQGADLFQVDANSTRLTVKDQMVEMIIKSKQHAVIYGNWILALYPQPNHTRMPVLVNLKTGLWTTDLTSSFALTSPAHNMLIALQKFYGEECRLG